MAGVFLVWGGAATAQPLAEPAPHVSDHVTPISGEREIPKTPNPATAATSSTQPSRADVIWLHLDDALRMAEGHAPELLAAEAERQGVKGLSDAANRRLHRPPRVEMSVGPRHTPSGGRLGFDATIGAFQEISLAGYGRSLSAYADSAKERAERNLELVRREARVRAYLSWLDALEARELLKLRREALSEIGEILRVTEARLAAGRSSPGEAALARALVGAADANVLSAQGVITQADATLRHICGIDLHRPLEIEGTLDAPPLLVDEESVRAKVREVAPDLKAARAEAASLARSAELGRVSSRPHLELGPSVTREGTGDWVFLGHVRMPLPGVDPAAAENAERKLQAHVARARIGVVEQAVLRDVEIALHEREHALKTRELLRQSSILPARLAVNEAQLQYEAGRNDLVSVITARRELYDALERWTRAAIDVQRADARLERFYLPQSHQKGSK